MDLRARGWRDRFDIDWVQFTKHMYLPNSQLRHLSLGSLNLRGDLSVKDKIGRKVMPLKSFLCARTVYLALLIGASLVVSGDMCVAQSGEYGRITLVNGTDADLTLNVKHLFPPTIIASCQAPPKSACTTGAIPTGLLDLEALSADGSKKFAKTTSLVSGENDVWSVSDSPR